MGWVRKGGAEVVSVCLSVCVSVDLYGLLHGPCFGSGWSLDFPFPAASVSLSVVRTSCWIVF